MQTDIKLFETAIGLFFSSIETSELLYSLIECLGVVAQLKVRHEEFYARHTARKIEEQLNLWYRKEDSKTSPDDMEDLMVLGLWFLERLIPSKADLDTVEYEHEVG